MAIHRRVLDCFAALAMTLLLLIAVPASAQDFPKLTGRVVDAANVLTAAEEHRVSSRSAYLERRTSDQLVVVTVPTLAGLPIETYSTKLGNAWGVGQQTLDNGVLIVVAPNEKKVRIAVGYGLEGLLTDARAAAIVSDMLPHFARKRCAAAIELGEREVIDVLLSDTERPQRKGS